MVNNKKVFVILALFLFLLLIGKGRAEELYLTASWYSIASLKTEGTYKYSKGIMANGKEFRENDYTAASCDFPLKTKLRITNIKDPTKNIVVEITDRINKRFKGKRIDLSKGAFRQIANLKQGIISVKIEIIKLAKAK